MTDQPPQNPQQPGQAPPTPPPAPPPPGGQPGSPPPVPPAPPGQPGDPNAGYQYYNPAQGAQVEKTDPFAIASLICGIVSLLCFGIILGLVALGLGFASINRMKSDPYLKGRGLAIGGMVCGGVGVALFFVWIAIGGLDFTFGST